MNKPSKKTWPTKAAMQQIYELNLWGKQGVDFYSGDGSHNPKLVYPYIDQVCKFLKAFKAPISVCDLGCGDFNVGRQLIEFTQEYTAVDIVPELISHLETSFKTPNLNFLSLDIAKDQLPEADCAILRQVLQHLSNDEIIEITKKLNLYQFIILTEHLPTGDFIPNKDIISGQGIRLKKQSGVDLLEAPFNLKVKSQRTLLSIPLEAKKGKIETVLYKMW
jgi:hypothetical protein